MRSVFVTLGLLTEDIEKGAAVQTLEVTPESEVPVDGFSRMKM